MTCAENYGGNRSSGQPPTQPTNCWKDPLHVQKMENVIINVYDTDEFVQLMYNDCRYVALRLIRFMKTNKLASRLECGTQIRKPCIRLVDH